MPKFSFRVILVPWLHLTLISLWVARICIVFVVCIEYYEITVVLQLATFHDEVLTFSCLNVDKN